MEVFLVDIGFHFPWVYNCSCFPLAAALFYILPTVPTILIVCLYPRVYEVLLHCGLICISLMTNDTEHLFICLLTICISSLDEWLFKSLALFYWVIWSTEVFNFGEAQFICFLFIFFTFGVLFKKPLHSPIVCIPIFSSKSSIVLALTLRSLTFLSLFFYVVKTQLHSFLYVDT